MKVYQVESSSKRQEWAMRLIGAFLVVHFALVCTVKAQRGLEEEIWWVSHIALVIAGIGLTLRIPILWTTALINILFLHGAWLVDFLMCQVWGSSPLRATYVLADGNLWTWLATCHHFYLVPLLLTLFLIRRQLPEPSLVMAATLFLYLTVISRCILSPASNVNYAYGISVSFRHPWIDWFNRLPGDAYLVGVNVLAAVLLFVPAALMLTGMARLFNRKAAEMCARRA